MAKLLINRTATLEAVAQQRDYLNGVYGKGALIGPSRGYTAMAKLTPAQLTTIGDKLAESWPKTSNYTAFALFCGHALPTTHIEAQALAIKFFDANGTSTNPHYSMGTRWHSTPKQAAKIITSEAHKQYSATVAQTRGSYTLRCATVGHAMRTDRRDCLQTCVQVIVNASTGKSLYSVATDKAFTFVVAKRATSTKKRPQAKKPEAQPEVQPTPINPA